MAKPRLIEQGNNSDEALRGYFETHKKIVDKINALQSDLKDNLNSAKGAGFLKTAIRQAYKQLVESEEHRQVRKEIESATKQYVEIAADLFAHADRENAA